MTISAILYIIMLKEMMDMPQIRPISDLRNHFAEITQEVQATGKPVFLTKNGSGSIVVMSMEAYEQGLYESEVYTKLMEAEVEAHDPTTQWATHDEVMASLEALLTKCESMEGKRV